MEIDFSKFNIVWPPSYYGKLNLERALELSMHNPSKEGIGEFAFLTPNLVSVVFSICEKLNYSFRTKLLALNLAEACGRLTREGSSSDVLLLLFQSVALASKMYERETVNFDVIHELTGHAFTNPQLVEIELRMIEFMDFKLMNSERFKIRTNLLEYVFLVEEYLPPAKFLLFLRLCEMFMELTILSNTETRQQKVPDALLCCGVIQAALASLTHNFGKFPITWRLQTQTKLDEVEIMKFSKRLMKVCLTREFMAELGAGTEESPTD